MKATDHMRYQQYAEFLISRNLMKVDTTNKELYFGFWIWLKTVEQAENIIKQTEACNDVHGI